MVPDEFHDFFVASAGVAGALIGLLFVAISVHPEHVGEGGDAALRFRPSAALSALLNALLVALIMLVPRLHVGYVVVALGVTGLVAVVALLAGVLRRLRHDGRLAVARTVLLLVGQGAIYVSELVLGLRLLRGTDPTGPLQVLCVLVMVLFAIGIERSWEFVGARMPGLLTAVLSLRQHGPGGG